MDPVLIGTRLASAAIGPILKKLLVSEGPGAGITGQSGPVRLSALVSFRGEKRTLGEKDVRKLAAALVARSQDDAGRRPFPADETEAVTDALAATLLALGDLDMDDVQAVRLGSSELARRLRAAAPAPDGLATDSVRYLETLTDWACLHILEFFTRRSTFVARTLVEQTRGQTELIAKVDELIRRIPRADGRDADFERRYLDHLARKHGRLTIYGIDLHRSPGEWPLDMAYLSLEATGTEGRPGDTVLLGPQRREHTPLHADLALARHDKVLLRGLAGSGKTTLVQWLTASAASAERPEGMAYLHGRIPFVLPLRTLTRHGERLPAPDRFLPASGCPLTPPDGWVDRVLAAGRGLILVDGIDEIPETERGRARDWLRDLLTAYEGNRWLVTARPTAVAGNWLARDGFADLTLSPMSRTEVDTFVRRWHKAAGPDAAAYEQPLLDALRTTEHVAQLATSPLMCGLVCALHRDRHGYLPRGRKTLYDSALSMLLSRRDRERGMGNPYGIELDEAPQIQLVQRLAYWLTRNGRLQMDREHARSIVTEAVPAMVEASAYAPDQVFTHLLHRSGLLREPTTDTVDFVHRTFQDYLAAKALIDHWDIGVLVEHADDDRWEDVIRMAVGHARPRECAEILRELLKAADTAEDRPAQLRLLVLAATALSHATEVAQAVREEVLARTAALIPPRSPEEARELATAGRLVLDLLPGPEGLGDEDARMVVTTATHIPAEAALPYLARFADHPALPVRAQLIWGWQRFDATAYAEAVVTRLDPEGLDFSVVRDDQAAELLRRGLHPERLLIGTDVPDEAVRELLAACDPVSLKLTRLGTEPDLTALSGLTRLETLTLDLPDASYWRLADVPAGTPLKDLSFSSWPQEGLGALHAYTALRDLALWAAYPLTAHDWRELAGLPRLRTLAIEETDLDSVPDGLVLPHIRALVLDAMDDTSPLRAVTRVFPGLWQFGLVTGTDDEVDVSPLAALADLEILRVSSRSVTGADRLADTVEIRFL
ncbi:MULTISPECIES: NACHT domain-containing protein [unclassified Streptomyces]|uniref:NACHT domain-containing protein n=1 Tax=unclassified Streptomyces TaxID=2593676 RepID=UPI0016605B09|nr:MULTISPECIES: NACHT domain-containing protein [unclassified Streptomyces]MBD0707607.1 ATP-binding protein [Streptomyces sp. CBMA291]MBD0716346.1 ATP-binding protein [Streptomyces sp. CBMA370]